MLSYRHGFHAGGWADVHKHVVLTMVLAHLARKPTPFTVVDAYAGDALYDLASPEALKTREFEGGIARIIDCETPPPGVASYIAAVRAMNLSPSLRVYPGSPALIRAMLRDGDRLIANELHPTAHRALAEWAQSDRRIAVHRRDAQEFLRWVATPKLRRGLVLIDPAYEVKAEYAELPVVLRHIATAWPGGIYVLWYPILREGRHRGMLAALKEQFGSSAGLCITEIQPPVPPASGMQGSGVAIINPPWTFAEEIEAASGWLARSFWNPRAPSRSA
jgi:23S rRNA (adenine2030-N6)-methyltransferase